MSNFVIILMIMLVIIYLIDMKKKEHFTNCAIYGGDYNACYSDPECTIGFAPDGMTTCMKKFIQEDI